MIRKTFNSKIFKLRDFQSHTPNVLGFSAHPVAEEGDYTGVVYKGDQVLRTISLECKADAQNTQINIDFTEHDSASALKNNLSVPGYSLKTGGYILLYTSSQLEDYSFKLFQIIYGEQKLVFDSKNLGAGDIYTVTLLEPGNYTAQSTASKLSMKISVAVPGTNPGKPFQVPDPISVDVNTGGFSINEADLLSGQGLVFMLKTDTDILISFSESDAKEERLIKDKPIFRWTNPNTISKNAEKK